jgi:solute:Na+ symporter, SSS family
VKLAKWISVLLGVIVVLLSSVMAMVSGNLFEVSQKVVNLFVAPLFGLFFMAIFVRFATSFGTLAGAAAGVATAATINYWPDVTGRPSPVSFLWSMPISLTIQVLVGCTFSLLPIGQRAGERELHPTDKPDRAPGFPVQGLADDPLNSPAAAAATTR